MAEKKIKKEKSRAKTLRSSESKQEARSERDIAEERYRDLAEGIDHGIVWEADEELRFCMVSRRAEQILGYSLAQWCGEDKFWERRLHPEDRERVIELFKKASEEGEDQSGDHRLIAADGRTVWFHTGIHAAREKERVVYRGISVEITYLKEMTEKLRQKTAEAEEANRFKSQILSVVSHEIRTPLNAILGYSGLLRNPEIEKNEAKQREMVDRIYRNAQILLDFINAILDLNKIEAGKMAVQTEEVGLPDMIRDVVNNLRPAAEEKGLTIKVSAGPPALPIRSDPGRIWQIFTNLITNAIKFTDGGSVEVKVLDHPSERKLSVIIRDTGVGISEKELSKIFEPFYQVESSPSRSGSGLGLSIVKKSIELLKGEIEVTSRPGIGTTFEVSLPYDLSL